MCYRHVTVGVGFDGTDDGAECRRRAGVCTNSSGRVHVFEKRQRRGGDCDRTGSVPLVHSIIQLLGSSEVAQIPRTRHLCGTIARADCVAGHMLEIDQVRVTSRTLEDRLSGSGASKRLLKHAQAASKPRLKPGQPLKYEWRRDSGTT